MARLAAKCCVATLNMDGHALYSLLRCNQRSVKKIYSLLYTPSQLLVEAEVMQHPKARLYTLEEVQQSPSWWLEAVIYLQVTPSESISVSPKEQLCWHKPDLPTVMVKTSPPRHHLSSPSNPFSLHGQSLSTAINHPMYHCIHTCTKITVFVVSLPFLYSPMFSFHHEFNVRVLQTGKIFRATFAELGSGLGRVTLVHSTSVKSNREQLLGRLNPRIQRH